MDSLRINELPEEERPREKLQKFGPPALSDAELIALILGSGVQGINVVDMSQTLLRHFGSLQNLSRATVPDLMEIRGIGPARAIQLVAVFGLGHRLASEQLHAMKIDSPEIVYNLLGNEMRSLNKESLRVLLLNTKYHLIRAEEISLGTLNQCIAHPRDIFVPAIKHSAFAFILVHNHPSGDPSPSKADIQLTKRLTEGARYMEIKILDHIILGSPGHGSDPYFSFEENGLL